MKNYLFFATATRRRRRFKCESLLRMTDGQQRRQETSDGKSWLGLYFFLYTLYNKHLKNWKINNIQNQLTWSWHRCWWVGLCCWGLSWWSWRICFSWSKSWSLSRSSCRSRCWSWSYSSITCNLSRLSCEIHRFSRWPWC